MNTGNVIIVNIESRTSKSDTTVKLHPGDHGFITNESTVRYHDLRIISIATLKKWVINKYAIVKDPVSPEVLKIICKGLLKSKFTPNEIKTFYSDITWTI